MPWFSAHAVMYLKWLDDAQDQFVVLENVYLIEAADRAAAHILALERAKREEESQASNTGRTGGGASASLAGPKARWLCAGIRKVVDVFHLSPQDTLAHGDELTYSQLAFRSEAQVLAFAGGADLSVLLDDQLANPKGTPRW